MSNIKTLIYLNELQNKVYFYLLSSNLSNTLFRYFLENIYSSQNVSDKDSCKISSRSACEFLDSTTNKKMLSNQDFNCSK